MYLIAFINNRNYIMSFMYSTLKNNMSVFIDQSGNEAVV